MSATDPVFAETWFHAPLRGPGDAAPLPEGEAHHLLRVLRLQAGARIVVTNGEGGVFLAETRAAPGSKGEGLEAVALEPFAPPAPAPRLHVVLSLLKGRDTEEPVEGLCQLPLAAIHLVISDFTQAFKGQDHAKLVERLRQKSLVALKQAKKPWLTAVHPPLPLREWRRRHSDPLILVHPGPDRLPHPESAAYAALVGPEGGFSEAELRWLREEEGCHFLGLGETRLRATHAPLVACGKLMGLGLL